MSRARTEEPPPSGHAPCAGSKALVFSTAILSFAVVVVDAASARASHHITQIIDAIDDGAGHVLAKPNRIAVHNDGSVYVTGASSNNAFRISAPTIPALLPAGQALLAAVLGLTSIRIAARS